ncbi:MAG: hypothetical protein R2713_09020 [Ilumatobacteraceae bacterium]
MSGYIETVPPPGQPKLTGSGASRLVQRLGPRPRLGRRRPHQRPGAAATARHGGGGRDYFDVTPVRGVVIGPAATQRLTVGVDVTSGDAT